MNHLLQLKIDLINLITTTFSLVPENTKNIEIILHVDNTKSFGDLSCNAALVLSRALKQKPSDIATKIKEVFSTHPDIESIEIAGPGFINIKLKKSTWQALISEFFRSPELFFKERSGTSKKRYLIEFVSANPTGPMHLGHGRNGIIGDVLSRALTFLGHEVTREFYINDAGTQVEKLGLSLKARCEQQLGQDTPLPEGGYAGEYVIELAQQCIKENGSAVIQKDAAFFTNYGITHLLECLKKSLSNYGVTFDSWFSEKTLHPAGIEAALQELKDKDLMYQEDGAWWFKSSAFGDEKDRVIKKSDGVYTYIAADIAYHKNKFDRGYDYLIDILGQDHHGYITRLKGTMLALGYPADRLAVILYQLVSIKNEGVVVKMSKRAGTFTELQEVIDTVGVDVARFFYLNRKAEAHLEFDLATALKKTEENPVYYIQYAYVRTKSILAKAQESPELKQFIDNLNPGKSDINQLTEHFGADEIVLFKKILSLSNILESIERTYQTHIICYYTLELAQQFHGYYAHNKVINLDDIEQTKSRLLMIYLLKNSFEICLDLLGLSKPEKM